MIDPRVSNKKFFISLLQAYSDDITNALSPRIKRERKAIKAKYAKVAI